MTRLAQLDTQDLYYLIDLLKKTREDLMDCSCELEHREDDIDPDVVQITGIISSLLSARETV